MTDHAKNNSQSYRVDLTKTVVYRYSFFPRTTIDWNNLEQEIVSSKTLESFKTQISHCPKNIECSPLVRWCYAQDWVLSAYRTYISAHQDQDILQLWQSEWDELPGNKLHEIFPVLKQCVVCPQTNRKEETVIAQLHISILLVLIPFYWRVRKPPMCIGCDELLTIAHILLTCSDLIEIREGHFTAQSLRVVSGDSTWDNF